MPFEPPIPLPHPSKHSYTNLMPWKEKEKGLSKQIKEEVVKAKRGRKKENKKGRDCQLEKEKKGETRKNSREGGSSLRHH